MEPRISMITLGGRDLPAAVRFYGEGQGLPRRASPPEVAFFTLDGTWLGLYGREALAADAGVDPAGSGFSGVTLAHNVTSRAAVDTMLAQARAAGASWLRPAREADWGGYSGDFADPHGHLWEVACSPFFRIGPPARGD